MIDLAPIVENVTRRQHGRGGPSLSEELLMRHPDKSWPANRMFSTSIWQKLRKFNCVTGSAAESRLTSVGYSVREEILKARKVDQ